MSKASLIPVERIERQILLLRGQKVLLDFQLAGLYGVETKALNQAVKRNLERFPEDFMFQLSEEETRQVSRSQIVTLNGEAGGIHSESRDFLRSQVVTSRPKNEANPLDDNEILRSQIVTSKAESTAGGRRYYPYAFTEQGVAMLSSVLRSPRAVLVNIAIMRTFVLLRRMLASHEDLSRKLAALENKYDAQFKSVFDAIRELMRDTPVKKRPEIDFHTLLPARAGKAATTSKARKP